MSLSEKVLYTPNGEPIKESELEEAERIECPHCHFAVIEDEFIPCECGDNACLYCWEDEGWVCLGCNEVNPSMRNEDVTE